MADEISNLGHQDYIYCAIIAQSYTNGTVLITEDKEIRRIVKEANAKGKKEQMRVWNQKELIKEINGRK